MADHLFGAIELGLVFGGAIAWGLWEIRAVRRAPRDAAPEHDETRPPGRPLG